MSWFPEQAGNGLDRVYYHLIRSLPEAGVSVCGLVAGSPEVARSSHGRVRAFAPETARLPVRWRAMRCLFARVRAEHAPDVVAAHFALYALPVLDQLRSVPLVVHFHGPWALESAVEGAGRPAVRGKALVERLVYRRGARFVVLSDAFRSLLHRRYGVPAERIRVVPGGVSVERFACALTRREARERLGWPVDRPVVLAVRRLARRMGLDTLIDAVGEVRRRVPEVLLLIAGRGPLEAALGRRIREAGLERHVRLLGFLPDEDLPLAYRAANLTIVPTLALEGFGLTTVESLAAGTPVLVTPVGGLPEVVRDLAPHLILRGCDRAALAEGLAAALGGTLHLPDPERCRAFVRQRHDWPVVTRRIRDVYAEVV